MGQKVNPIGLRLGINRTWDSRWYARHNYATLLHQDLKLRKYIKERLSKDEDKKKIAKMKAKSDKGKNK